MKSFCDFSIVVPSSDRHWLSSFYLLLKKKVVVLLTSGEGELLTPEASPERSQESVGIIVT